MDSLVLPDKEPLLLAATESAVYLYTRTSSSRVGDTSVLNKTSTVYTASSGQKIVEARFLKTYSNRDKAPAVYLSLTLQSYAGSQIQVYPLDLNKKAICKSYFSIACCAAIIII